MSQNQRLNLIFNSQQPTEFFFKHTSDVKHGTITDSSTITAFSNIIGVQLFEHMYGLKFHVIPEATSTFLMKQFALLLLRTWT
jgi:hypothetical protein